MEPRNYYGCTMLFLVNARLENEVSFKNKWSIQEETWDCSKGKPKYEMKLSLVNPWDERLAEDNRLLNAKSSYSSILMAPPCRLLVINPKYLENNNWKHWNETVFSLECYCTFETEGLSRDAKKARDLSHGSSIFPLFFVSNN